MNTRTMKSPASAGLNSQIGEALERIPPLWPLTHFVAVNPYLGLAHYPFAEACGVLRQACGVMPVQPPADYLDALLGGRIRMEDLWQVADDEWPVERLIAALDQAAEHPEGPPMMTFADFLDQQGPHAHWELVIEDEISKWCGVVFDRNQTIWHSPWKAMGLFAGWRHAAVHDCNPESNGLKGFRKFVTSLPATADETIAYCMQLLEQPKVDAVDFMHRQLMTISGWAGFARYQDREAILNGGMSQEARELLAIRLAYDAALFDAFARDGVQRAEWRSLECSMPDRDGLEALSRWQSAYEMGYQQDLAGKLTEQAGENLTMRPPAQAVFCIDVRSERIRRHLESSMTGIQTIGFAGFFGFPISHLPPGREQTQARCPVLLAPPVAYPQSIDAEGLREAVIDRKGKRIWKAFQTSATSCFSFVESLGLGFVAALCGLGKKPHDSCCDQASPDLSKLSVKQMADMAEGALRNMSLTKNFARLVLICGHGSHSSNNPYASALDCGACGGHAGDLNARLAAETLNHPEVRITLAERGIEIPEDTWFLSGLHDTLADELSVFGSDALPESHREELEVLREALNNAGKATRAERASSLGLADVPAEDLDVAVKSRGSDMSQVRPEWGLANNAALVVARRSRTKSLDLDGRVFLHDYDHESDHGLKVLNLILSAPVVVASWINLQYYASRVNPEQFGSGDKAIHNVLGGIGVMEGNGGDLRTGLPMQSIHDGEKFVHEPRRLTVYIEAPCGSISEVLDGLPGVRQLFDHGWIHLVALDGCDSYRYASGRWIKR